MRRRLPHYPAGQLDSAGASGLECARQPAREQRMAQRAAQRSSKDEAMPQPVGKSAEDYLGRVRDLAPALAAAGGEIDRRRELPEAIVQALVERGLFRL